VIAVIVSPPAADVAFYVVFGAAAIAFVVLSVITLKWAFRRDLDGRRAWVQRQQSTSTAEAPPPAANGRSPSTPSRTPRKPPS